MIMPQMGESIAEATISKWLKQLGDAVQKDEIILEISTDKVDSEIPSPATGILSEVLYKAGDVVPVKVKIAVIDTDQTQKAASTSATASQPQASSASINPSTNNPNGSSATQSITDSGSDRFYSPLVRSLAEKHGVLLSELSGVSGSGQGGRLTKQDFLDYVESRATKQTTAVAQPTTTPTSNTTLAKSSAPSVQTKPASSDMPSFDWSGDGTKIVPMDNMRQAIADHMVRSKHTSPHVYSVQEVDVTNISQWRKANKSLFEKQEGFGLSFTPFFLEAAVKGLVQFPLINSSVDGKKIIMKKHVNLGCAVALGNSGLIVPVIKRAEEKNIVGLARGLNDLALRARNKKLLPDDVAGGTFTVTNPGVFGTIIGTPIINQPQVAILCLGAIKKRPVVIDDMIAIREICYLTLSYDHRIIDGSLGGQYLAFLREYLENWDLKRPLY